MSNLYIIIISAVVVVLLRSATIIHKLSKNREHYERLVTSQRDQVNSYRLAFHTRREAVLAWLYMMYLAYFSDEFNDVDISLEFDSGWRFYVVFDYVE